MLSDKEFLEFLNDKSIDKINKENLRQIIDEEMEKPEEEMNPELIEYCLDMLNKQDNEKDATEKEAGATNGKRITLKVKKFIAVAAVAAVLLAGTLTASAIILDVNLFDGIVEIYNDYVRINFDKTENKSDNYELLDTELAKKLADNGFEPVLLPEAFFTEEYKITKIEYEFGEFLDGANIIFEYKNKLGSIDISKYAFEELVADVEFLNVTSSIEEIDFGKTTVYCFMQNKNAAITYRDGLLVYFIQIPMDLDEAMEFAKTIK